MNELPLKLQGINYGHSRSLLIGNPEAEQQLIILDTRFRGYDERGIPWGIYPEDKN